MTSGTVVLNNSLRTKDWTSHGLLPFFLLEAVRINEYLQGQQGLHQGVPEIAKTVPPRLTTWQSAWRRLAELSEERTFMVVSGELGGRN